MTSQLTSREDSKKPTQIHPILSRVKTFFTGESLFLLIYTISSILSIFFPICQTFCLADAMRRFVVIRQVLYEIFFNQVVVIGQTAVLALFFIYGFAQIAFVFLNGYYDSQCNTLLQCFVFHLGAGVRGGSLAANGPDFFAESGAFVGKFTFDYAYYLLITVILTALVTGIVIDAFGGKRLIFARLILIFVCSYKG